MGKDKKKGKHTKKVFPNEFDEIDHQLAEDGYEMDSIDEAKRSIKNKNKLKAVSMLAGKAKLTGIDLVANVKTISAKWKHYVTSRRTTKSSDGGGGQIDRRKTGGLGLDYECAEIPVPKKENKDHVDGTLTAHHQMVVAHNRNLVEYFARLGQSKKENESVSLEYVASLLKNGADVNCTDKYGQTIFHEVARAWHTDIALFLLDNGANVNQQDNYGRSPLHVAAAVDYADMVNCLISKNANKEILTKGERQTPVHFAARNDACNSLRALIRAGCQYKEVRDFKGRTPLHVAAELDRSETARLLLELDDPAPAGVEDHGGQSAMVWMIIKMPPVARVALDQFHTMDRANRKQFFHLHSLEPRKPDTIQTTFPQTALAVTVAYRRYDLIIHPALSRLCGIKWKRFARLHAILQVVLNLAFILTWTLQGVIIDYDQRHEYILPQHWWRIVLFLLAIFFTGWQLKDELTEFFTSRKNHQRWKDWRTEELERDQEYTHPRWPEEEQYLVQELDDLDRMSPQYFSDFWNIFDWVCYALLLVSIITHLVDIFQHTQFIARLHIRIMAINIILIWLRLLKNARAFSYLGPFIVMLTHMMSDVLRFAILYLEFYIPFACAFWMIFGGNKIPESGQNMMSNETVVVQGMHDANALAFSLFRLTLVDDYDYDGMKAVDSVMADILVGTWLALSAILMLNLFIALLSDTFQRVYDNAQANAVMQKAITILNIEEGMSHKRREKFRKYIHTECNPKSEFYDDDVADTQGEADLKKVTIQIKEQLDGMESELKEQLSRSRNDDNDMDFEHESNEDNNDGDDDNKPDGGGGGGGTRRRSTASRGVSVDKFESEVDLLRDEIHGLKEHNEDLMENFRDDLDDIKSLLHQLVSAGAGGGGLGGPVRPPGGRPVPPGMDYGGGLGGMGGGGANTFPSHFHPREPAGPIHAGHTLPLGHAPNIPLHQETDWDRMERERTSEMRRLRSQLGISTPRSRTPPVATVDVNLVTTNDERNPARLVPVLDRQQRPSPGNNTLG